MALPTPTSLSTNIDATYSDAGDPSRVLHQQAHDTVHAAVNGLTASGNVVDTSSAQTLTNKTIPTHVSKAGGDTILASGAAVVPLVVKGTTSQSANLFEARDAGGTLLLSVASNGATFINNYTQVMPSAANVVGLAVRGFASQSVSLQEWQNNAGTPVAYVAANGNIKVGGTNSVVLTGSVNGSALGAYGGGINVIIDGSTYRFPFYV